MKIVSAFIILAIVLILWFVDRILRPLIDREAWRAVVTLVRIMAVLDIQIGIVLDKNRLIHSCIGVEHRWYMLISLNSV